jgi:hypothetical protein
VPRNYLLHFTDEKWAPLACVFDEKWFMSCESESIQRSRLIHRHLQTWTAEKTAMWGEGEEGAAKKADSNDILNAAFVDSVSRYLYDITY